MNRKYTKHFINILHYTVLHIHHVGIIQKVFNCKGQCKKTIMNTSDGTYCAVCSVHVRLYTNLHREHTVANLQIYMHFPIAPSQAQRCYIFNYLQYKTEPTVLSLHVHCTNKLIVTKWNFIICSG